MGLSLQKSQMEMTDLNPMQNFREISAIAWNYPAIFFYFNPMKRLFIIFPSSVAENLLPRRRWAVMSDAGVCPPKW